MNYEVRMGKGETGNWKMGTGKWELSGLFGGAAKMAILHMRETEITKIVGISFRMSTMRRKQSILCKHTARGTNLECPLESTRAFGNDAKRAFHTNQSRPTGLQPKKLKVMV